MSFDGVRCRVCNAVDADEWPDGTANCANCGAVLSHDTPEPNTERRTVYPLLAWSWAPCQRCGSEYQRHWDPEYDSCPECGAVVTAIMRRDFAEGYPTDSKTHRPKDSAPILVGDQGVWGSADEIRLVPCDPFTLLEVNAVHADGDLDLVSTQDGTQWMKVSRRPFLRLFR